MQSHRGMKHVTRNENCTWTRRKNLKEKLEDDNPEVIDGDHIMKGLEFQAKESEC